MVTKFVNDCASGVVERTERGAVHVRITSRSACGSCKARQACGLAEAQEKVVVVDSLVTGHRAAVNPAAKFYQGDLADQEFMRGVFRENPDIDAVIHFAAFSLVAESMKEPLKYFDNNTAGMVKLLEVMKEFGVKKIVFSSTAATYGIPEKMPIREDDPQKPINPYGESKLMMEKIMRWCDQAYGIKFVALRYFNVAGAKPDGSIGEDHGPETHLLPIVLQVAQGKRDKLMIFGDDYNTPDGTNVRDYVQAALDELCGMSEQELLSQRYDRFRKF